MPIDHSQEKIKINRSEKDTWVMIDGLCKSVVQTMYKSIYFPVTNQMFFDVPIYCKPLRTMTPQKNTTDNPATPAKKAEANVKVVDTPADAKTDNVDPPKPTIPIPWPSRI